MLAHMTQSDVAQVIAFTTLVLANGNTISVNDGEEWVVKKSTESAVVLEAMASTEADTIKVRDVEGNTLGIFYLVYGNEPGVLIADHTDNEYCNQLSAAMAALFDTM